MKNRTDNGRTKFNTDTGQFPETRQKPSAGQDVPLNDGHRPPETEGMDRGQQSGRVPGQQRQDELEQQGKFDKDEPRSPLAGVDLPRNPQDEASQTGHGFIGKSEFGGGQRNAPRKGDLSGVERKGGTQQ